MLDSFPLGRHTKSRRKGRATPRSSAKPNRLRFEWLEDRRLLSTNTASTLLALPSTSQYGQPVELVDKVSTTPASPRGSGPTGTVSFYLGNPTGMPAGTLLGTANVTQRGIATLKNESSPLPVGATDTIYAVYSGDSNFATSENTATVTVDQAATTTTIAAAPNPGVSGGSVTFTAVVSGESPNWSNNGGTIAPPTGTVTFTVNGAPVSGSSVTFVGDKGLSAIYTYTTQASSLTATPNSVTASYRGDTNYQASSSRTLSYQVVSAADAGTGTITAGSATSPLSLKGGQTFSINYSSTLTTPPTPNTVTYADSTNGISLAGSIASVVFSSNGKAAEITGTGTNTTGKNTTTTPVNFTLSVNTASGWLNSTTVSISIVGNTAVTTSTGTAFRYNQTGILASGSTVTISETGSTATIPPGGGLPGGPEPVLPFWPFGGGGSGSGGLGGGGSWGSGGGSSGSGSGGTGASGSSGGNGGSVGSGGLGGLLGNLFGNLSSFFGQLGRGR